MIQHALMFEGLSVIFRWKNLLILHLTNLHSFNECMCLYNVEYYYMCYR